MEFFFDNQETDRAFKQLLSDIRHLQNGEVAAAMARQGIIYKMNWGLTVPVLKTLAGNHKRNHVLALRLWNKKWRETMILATMLDEPEKVTEEQIEYWASSFSNTEICEQTAHNLFIRTPFAFVKAMEFCRAKKYFTRYTGVVMAGKLASLEKSAADEMFEPFFDLMKPLACDHRLSQALYNTFVAMALRSPQVFNYAATYVNNLKNHDNEQARIMGELLRKELIILGEEQNIRQNNVNLTKF